MTIGLDADDPVDPEDDVILQVEISYPKAYPSNVPDFLLIPLKGSLDADESSRLHDAVKFVAEQNLGEAMTFTVISSLKEDLTEMVRDRSRRRKESAEKAEQLTIQAEAQRLRGTPVTSASFEAWRVKFVSEMNLYKEKGQDEKLKGLSSKERDEFKRVATRPTGRQLFEKNKHLDEFEDVLEDDVVSVDFRQYSNFPKKDKQDEGESLVIFEDSD